MDCSAMIIMKVVSKFAIIWTGATNDIDRNTTLTYLEANEMCQCLYNHTLASIHSEEENEVVKEMMIDAMILPGETDYPELAKDDLTIGLDRIRDPNEWTWIDGTKLDFTNWERKTRTEPDPTDLYAQVERQISTFNWYGRNSEPEIPFQRWFLCDTGEEFDNNIIRVVNKDYFPLYFYPILAVVILILCLFPCILFRKVILISIYKCVE